MNKLSVCVSLFFYVFVIDRNSINIHHHRPCPDRAHLTAKFLFLIISTKPSVDDNWAHERSGEGGK